MSRTQQAKTKTKLPHNTTFYTFKLPNYPQTSTSPNHAPSNYKYITTVTITYAISHKQKEKKQNNEIQ